MFFGGEWDLQSLNELITHVRKSYDYKIALYSGNNIDFFDKNFLKNIDFIKVGNYDKNLGSLVKKTTKDKLVIMVTHNNELAYSYANRVVEFKDGEVIEDLTKLFWRKVLV